MTPDDLVVTWVLSLLAKARTHWPEILTRLEALLGVGAVSSFEPFHPSEEKLRAE